MPAAEPPTIAAPPAQASAMAAALSRIAELRLAGFDLVYPERDELARLVRCGEVVSVRAEQEQSHG